MRIVISAISALALSENARGEASPARPFAIAALAIPADFHYNRQPVALEVANGGTDANLVSTVALDVQSGRRIRSAAVSGQAETRTPRAEASLVIKVSARGMSCWPLPQSGFGLWASGHGFQWQPGPKLNPKIHRETGP